MSFFINEENRILATRILQLIMWVGLIGVVVGVFLENRDK